MCADRSTVIRWHGKALQHMTMPVESNPDLKSCDGLRRFATTCHCRIYVSI
jgi:hypothetical protein